MGGYFGIGIYHGKSEVNIGTLWRGAWQLGAAFIFTVGRRYKDQVSDTYKTWRNIPRFEYESLGDLQNAWPYNCQSVAIEMGGDPLISFKHPKRAVYILGAEDNGLPESVINMCGDIVSIPAIRQPSFNVAQAGTIVMYDRLVKSGAIEIGSCTPWQESG